MAEFAKKGKKSAPEGPRFGRVKANLKVRASSFSSALSLFPLLGCGSGGKPRAFPRIAPCAKIIVFKQC